ncbi:MAG: DUF309 domain-containing protein [Sulfurimonas sp.]|nr:DUF309 domain-containing protein [Sulfurimonas sp.]
MLTDCLDNFIECLEQHRYFDAHEALEVIWFPRRFEDDNEMKLLKGFINAAVSFELKKRGREEASKRVWKNYLKYKKLLTKINSPYLDRYKEISIYLDDFDIITR